MGIANQAQISSNSPIVTHKQNNSPPPTTTASFSRCSDSMSQDYRQQGNDGGEGGFFSFSASNGFERVQQQQMRREKLRVQAEFPPPPPRSLVGIDAEEEDSGAEGGFHHQQQPQQVCESTGMLSEMFNFAAPSGRASVAAAVDLLDHHQHPDAGDWYGGGDSSSKDNQSQNNGTNFHHQIPSTINADSAAAAAAMELFLSNPPRSPSPSQPQPPPSSTLHILLPDGYAAHPAQQFSWLPGSNPSEIGRGAVAGRGLSLSLSSSLQHLETAKAEEFRIGDGGAGGLLYYNPQSAAIPAAPPSSASAAAALYYKTVTHPHHHQQQAIQIGGFGFGSGSGVVNVLRSSRYVRAAAELLEEFCSVGRGQFKRSKLSRLNSNNSNNNGGGGSSTTKESPALPPLSASDRMEHQRRKVKLVSMLDEVDRRYNHYCEQMQTVVNSFDLVMGFGAAVPYTALAQKAMSRHFRCLKDAIAAQIRQACDLLGEMDAAATRAAAAGGITRGETPRLRALEQSLRQQRAFHQMGMMEQEAWRPQRGLPERSVNILRAWLFEHFLHPYPSDADKHLLARQTGLSRNQVSNWFINARVRLWKPMIEEMYQQESKEDDDVAGTSQDQENVPTTTQSTPPITPTSAVATTTPPAVKTLPEIPDENDVAPSSSSLAAMNNRQQQYLSDGQAAAMIMSSSPPPPSSPPPFHEYAGYGTGGMTTGGDHENFVPTNTADVAANALIRYGTTAAAGGDVSLTLGLRHAGNVPEKASSTFTIRDFGDC